MTWRMNHGPRIFRFRCPVTTIPIPLDHNQETPPLSWQVAPTHVHPRQKRHQLPHSHRTPLRACSRRRTSFLFQPCSSCSWGPRDISVLHVGQCLSTCTPAGHHLLELKHEGKKSRKMNVIVGPGSFFLSVSVDLGGCVTARPLLVIETMKASCQLTYMRCRRIPHLCIYYSNYKSSSQLTIHLPRSGAFVSLWLAWLTFSWVLASTIDRLVFNLLDSVISVHRSQLTSPLLAPCILLLYTLHHNLFFLFFIYQTLQTWLLQLKRPSPTSTVNGYSYVELLINYCPSPTLTQQGFRSNADHVHAYRTRLSPIAPSPSSRSRASATSRARASTLPPSPSTSTSTLPRPSLPTRRPTSSPTSTLCSLPLA